MEQEKLSLKWNDFQENLTSTFRMLGEDREFADVTLVCEDGQQVEAHKVILASSSPFFMNLLKRNKHPHPLIYMRGLKSENLVALVDFIYCGEANVCQENIESFMALAKEFELIGLMGSAPEKEATVIKKKPSKTKTSTPLQVETVSELQVTTSDISVPGDVVKTEQVLGGAVAVTDYTEAADLQDLNAKIKSMMDISDATVSGGKMRLRVCKVCGKEGMMGAIRNHIEAHHITGVSHTCDICGARAKSRNALGMHKQRNHSVVHTS